MARWAPITVALTLVGCTCGAPEATPPTPASATAPTATPAPPETAPATTPAERARPAIDPVIARQVREAVRDGRRLSREGRHADALARFEDALRLAPSPRLQCEAGFVAHRAEQHERARELVDRALHVLAERRPSNSTRVPLAMCLYNAGLVYEQAGWPDRALAAYERSLALRDHTTVREHADAMRALVARGTAPDVVAALGTFDAASDVEVNARIVTQFCEDAGLERCIQAPESDEGEAEGDDDESEGDDDEYETLVELSTEAPEGTAGGLEARIVIAAADTDQHAYLVVSVGTHRAAGRIAYAYTGSFGVTGELGIARFAYEDVIPGGPTEVVAIGTTSQVDLDMGGCEYTDEATRTLVACTIEGGAPRCASLVLEQSSDSGSDELEGCEELYGEGATPPEPESHGFSFDWAIEGSDLVLTAARTIDPSPDAAGRHPFAQLVADARRRWP